MPKELVGKGKNDWQEREYVLHQFHEKEGRAVRAYRRLMEEGKDQEAAARVSRKGIDTEFRGVVPGFALGGRSKNDRT